MNLPNDFDKNDFNLINRSLGKIIQKTMRKPDYFGRWNDKCFWIACPNTDFTASLSLIQRINEKIKKDAFISKSNIEISVTPYFLHENEGANNFIDRVRLKTGEKVKEIAEMI